MTNKNYENGAAKERRIINSFKKKGYEIAFRSAGSHSPIDCVIISKQGKTIKFIQCKPRKYSKIKTALLNKEYVWLNDNFQCNFEVI